ncbi:MAG: hypothetical protein ACM3ZV_13450 [Bacillota bacterium]
MRRYALAAAALASLVAAQPAFAGQCATVTFSPGNVTLPDYDPIAGGSVQASFTATVVRNSPLTTSVRLIFLDSTNTLPVRLGVVGTGKGPLYQILDGGGVAVVFPLGTGISTRIPKISLPIGPSGDAVSVNYLVNILANTANRDFTDGSYGENLAYSVECFQGLLLQGIDMEVSGPSLSVTIPNRVSMTTASPQTLDFQSFTTLRQQLNVGLKSTGPINVQLTTQNQRRMVLAGAPSPTPSNSYIAYSIALNGHAITTDPYILTNAPRAGVAGRSWPLVLSLARPPSGKIAGSYSDTITLTVTPGD